MRATGSKIAANTYIILQALHKWPPLSALLSQFIDIKRACLKKFMEQNFVDSESIVTS